MNIENLIRKFGDINGAFIDEAAEYGTERQRGGITLNKKRLITIALAAILAMAIGVTTVAAAAFTGLIGKEKAFEAARAYVIRNTDERGKVSTWTLFIEGLEYDTSVEETEVRLGLTAGLKSVYKVKFKIAGYAFDVTVDAKTGDVLDLSRETDDGWEEHLKEVEFRGPADGIWESEIVGLDAFNIAEDYFGLYNTGYEGCGVTGVSTSSEINFNTEPYSIHVHYEHGGYIYSCDVNGTTGEVMNAEIAEDESYSGERHQHEPNHGLIGLYRAVMIVREELGISREDSFVYSTVRARFVPNEFALEYEGELLPVYNGYGTDVYIVTVNQDLTQAGIAVDACTEIAVDAYTGEIIEIKAEPEDPTASDQDALIFEEEAKG